MILAGGAGTRLWPLARVSRPKQFLTLFGGKSLFQLTCERVLPLAGPGRILVVAGKAHAPWVRRQAPRIPRRHVILEETGRNTAASIALAAEWIRRRHQDGIMVVLPADHWVAPTAAFRETLRRGIRAVRRTAQLLVIGVPARSPETGFGYLRVAGRTLLPGIRRVAEFIEKPSAPRARRLLRSGRYLWNSGIFVWRASSILQELRRLRPGIARAAAAWSSTAKHGSRPVPATILRRMTAVPIDRAVLEGSRRLIAARAGFQWSDLGTWDAMADLIESGRRDNRGVGHLLALDAPGCAGFNEDGLTVFVGVKDLLAVRSGDVVLVCHRGAGQDVRRAVNRLERRLERYL